MIFVILLINLFISSLINSLNNKYNQNAFILDLSENTTCLDKSKTEFYLPFGAGSTDSVVILITNPSPGKQNCTLKFFTTHDTAWETYRSIVVFEIWNSSNFESGFCKQIGDQLILLESEGNLITDVCLEIVRNKALFYKIVTSKKFVVLLEAFNAFEVVKITATSAKYITINETCTEQAELQCKIDGKSFCISKTLQCDGNLNCGVPEKNDENPKICDHTTVYYNKLRVIIIFTVLVVIVVIFLFYNFLRSCVPKANDNVFIYHEDHNDRLIVKTQMKPPVKLINTRNSLTELKTATDNTKTVLLSKSKSTSQLMPTKKSQSVENKRNSLVEEIEIESFSYTDNLNLKKEREKIMKTTSKC